MSDMIPPSLDDTRDKPRKKKDSKAKPAARKRSLKNELAELFAAAGTAISMVNTYDGMVILDKSTQLAEELNELAQRNSRVYAVLDQLLTAGVWSGLVMVAASIAIPISANHGLLDRRLAPLFGQPMPPEPEPPVVEPEETEGATGTPGEAVMLPADMPDIPPVAPWVTEGDESGPVSDSSAAHPVG